MKTFSLSFLFIAIFSVFPTQTWANPIPPVGIIVEVFFEGDDWFLVADNYCMEMYGLESFEDVEISCSGGWFNFKPDFLPDFSSPRTLITKDALLNNVSINPVADQIWVDFPGCYSYDFLEWGSSPQAQVNGPLQGQTLILSLLTSNMNWDYVWFTVKGDSPDCYYSGCNHSGIFEGFVTDENGNPVVNSEIIYLPDYFYSGGYYFTHIYTNTTGFFHADYLPAKNYHIHKIIYEEIEYAVDEYISIEPNETTSMDFEIVLTETGENPSKQQAGIFSSPNPTSEATTFKIDLPATYQNEKPMLIITNMMGKIVDIVEIRTSQIKNNQATISWEKEASLPSGNYIVVLKAGNTKLSSHKITIE